MHWKTRKKLLGATRVYVTEADNRNDICNAVRIQLGTTQYVYIDLTKELLSISYQKLEGFGDDTNIKIHGKRRTLEILKASVIVEDIDNETLEEIIMLVADMKGLRR